MLQENSQIVTMWEVRALHRRWVINYLGKPIKVENINGLPRSYKKFKEIKESLKTSKEDWKWVLEGFEHEEEIIKKYTVVPYYIPLAIDLHRNGKYWVFYKFLEATDEIRSSTYLSYDVLEDMEKQQHNLTKNIKEGKCPFVNCKEYETQIVFNFYYHCCHKMPTENPCCLASSEPSGYWAIEPKKKHHRKIITRKNSITTDLIDLQIEKRIKEVSTEWVKPTVCWVCGNKLPSSKAWNIEYCSTNCRDKARHIKDVEKSERLDRIKKMLKIGKYEYLDRSKGERYINRNKSLR